MPTALSHAALSLKLFALYLVLLGAALMLCPTPLLELFQLPPTSEVWIRVAGVLAFNIGVYYWFAAKANSPALFLATFYTRALVLTAFTGFVLAGLSKPVLILFGSVDFLGGVWTLLALRADQRKR